MEGPPGSTVTLIVQRPEAGSHRAVVASLTRATVAVSADGPSVTLGVLQTREQVTTELERNRQGDFRDPYREVEEWQVSSTLPVGNGNANVANSASTDSLFYLDGQMDSRYVLVRPFSFFLPFSIRGGLDLKRTIFQQS